MFSKEDGFLGYNEVCLEAQAKDEPWTLEWDDDYDVPFMHKGKKWVSYDNEESVHIKAQFAHDENLAGVMVWSVETDDFRGKCGGGKFPLIRSINKALHDREFGRRK